MLEKMLGSQQLKGNGENETTHENAKHEKKQVGREVETDPDVNKVGDKDGDTALT